MIAKEVLFTRASIRATEEVSDHEKHISRVVTCLLVEDDLLSPKLYS